MNADRPFARFGRHQIRFTTAFAMVYLPIGLLRGMMVSLLPLQALELLGTARDVSVLYFVVGVGATVIALLLPRLARHLGSRWLLTIGVMCAVVAMGLLAQASLWPFLGGILLHAFSVGCVEMSLLLMVLSGVPRDQYSRFEPMRVVFSGSAFLVGPTLSIYLENHVSHGAPFILTAGATVLGLAYAWWLELGATAPTTPADVNPFRYIGRFLRQPRLLLAWSLSFTRYCWWIIFFVYTPIYAKQSGLGELTGGMIVSVGTASVLAAPLWGWFGRRFGIRRLFLVCFAITGSLSLVTFAFAIAGFVWWCAGALVLSAVAASVSDGGSHIPFYRAARVREQTEMAGVYATHREAGQLVPTGVIALLLKFFPLPVVFLTGGLMMLGFTYFCRYLPRRM